jgi:hypothetical protein
MSVVRPLRTPQRGAPVLETLQGDDDLVEFVGDGIPLGLGEYVADGSAERLHRNEFFSIDGTTARTYL